jgi:hypothetical protein
VWLESLEAIIELLAQDRYSIKRTPQQRRLLILRTFYAAAEFVNTFTTVESGTNPAFSHNITCMGFMAGIAGSAHKFRI